MESQGSLTLDFFDLRALCWDAIGVPCHGAGHTLEREVAGGQRFAEQFAEFTDGQACIREVGFLDRKSTRLNSSHLKLSRMPSSA